MASPMRKSNATRAGQYPSCNGIVRRMVSLPRSIFGGFSRAMGHGIDLMGIGGRRATPTLSPSFQLPLPQEWDFLENFERQFGSTHPFFYACHFMEALKIAQDENKFLFMYLHSPEHPFTPSFCRETLCSELAVQYLDANFVCWGALASGGEGQQMAAIFRPASFPFCAVIAPSIGDNMALLQQIEGPISPAELVEILQRTLEEQGAAFGSSRAKEAEKIRADRRLREEQDAAYLAALQIDKEKERLEKLSSKESVQKPAEAPIKANYEKFRNNPSGRVIKSSTIRETPHKETANKVKDSQATQILIRFPNGERREQSFSSTEKIQAIYRFIDSLALPGIGNYRLVSSFPRRVYGVDQMGQTLKDAGLHPRASLFLEIVLQNLIS
ncbi:plant UBX domain-containing protein 10 [Morus notabilis]|uniref:plant UBX domain-containing protein 10 n=1 Tax=Morus notabilis TaxID=981085 RepID=UPI000CED4BA1|nr:plant UBX domain-containing protein 10 [Morus notabilis]